MAEFLFTPRSCLTPKAFSRSSSAKGSFRSSKAKKQVRAAEISAARTRSTPTWTFKFKQVRKINTSRVRRPCRLQPVPVRAWGYRKQGSPS